MHEKLLKQLKESRYLRRPMKENFEDSAEYRWLSKEVSDVYTIDLKNEFDDSVRIVGPGQLSWADDEGIHGTGCPCMEYPTEQPIQNPTGRAYTTSEILVRLPHQNLTAYTRLSVWMKAESENSAINNVIMALYNETPIKIPVPGRFEGNHSITFPANQWTRILWEIPHLCREDVVGVGFAMLGAGTSYPGDKRVRIYLDNLRFETVVPDVYKGFDLPEGCIAYCHSGYRNDSPKQALAQCRADSFEIRDEAGTTVFTGKTQPARDSYILMDFSAFTAPGWYTLHVGEMATKPFVIGPEAYLASTWKSLNFFLAERCGCAVPNAHSECHLDVMSRHPDGRMKCVGGGWHDAGDLTQDGRNTMECTLAMLETAEAARDSQKELSDRALEEARWGLDWMMRIRWGDGYRHCGRIIAFWSDNALGTTDDVITTADNRPYDNLLSAQVFAKAARILADEDAMYAALCKRMAIEDYGFGADWVGKAPAQSFSFATQLQLTAQAALSAAELYRLTRDEQWLKKAAGQAKIVMRCQQIEVPEGFNRPIRGYFYETEDHKRIQSYFHRSYEQVPVEALTTLLTLAPDYPDAPKWRASMEAYADFLKETADVNVYGLIPAGVYELNNVDFSNMYHEGSRADGAPSLEEYNAQVLNGIMLNDTHSLRIFPVAYQFRGFHAITLAKGLAALNLAKLFDDDQLRAIGTRQLEWILGCNPFAVSGQYGEGYDYHPLYTGLQPQIVGALPVGFETFANEDIPYYPLQALATYKEIWVHTACRLLRATTARGFEA